MRPVAVLFTVVAARTRWSGAAELTLHAVNSASDLAEERQPVRLRATWPLDAPVGRPSAVIRERVSSPPVICSRCSGELVFRQGSKLGTEARFLARWGNKARL